jgi:hypothetical protein
VTLRGGSNVVKLDCEEYPRRWRSSAGVGLDSKNVAKPCSREGLYERLERSCDCEFIGAVSGRWGEDRNEGACCAFGGKEDDTGDR